MLGGKKFWVAGLWVCLQGSAVCAHPFEALEAVVTQAKNFSDFAARPELVTRYKKALETYYGRTTFSCDSFETIFANLKKLDREVPGFGAELWKAEAESSLVAYRSAGSREPRSRWELARVPRKLHAVWNDSGRRSCAAETCDRHEISAPERWSAALAGSATYLLHREGKFAGAGALVLPVVKEGKEFWLLSPTGSGNLAEPARYSDSPDAAPVPDSIQKRLLRELARIAPDVEPVQVEYRENESRLTKLAGRKESAGYLGDFEPASAMAGRVAKVLPRLCFAKQGKEAINLFAGFGPGPGLGVSAGLWSPGTVKSMLLQMGNPESVGTFASVPPEQKAQVVGNLSDLVLGAKSPSLRQKAAMALRAMNQASPSIFPAGRTTASVDATFKPKAPALSTSPSFTYRRALKDADKGVRTIAAAALSGEGDGSPEVRSALKQALEGAGETGRGGGGAMPWLDDSQLAAIAAAAMNQPGSGVGPMFSRDFGKLLARAGSEKNPERRKELVRKGAEAFRNSDQPADSLKELQELADTKPSLARELANAVNQEECPEEPAKRGSGKSGGPSGVAQTQAAVTAALEQGGGR